MLNIKEYSNTDILRLFNALGLLLSYGVECNEAMLEAFRMELSTRKTRSMDERIGNIIARHGEITHTSLLQRCSRYANAGDVVEATNYLEQAGDIKIDEYKGSKGKIGRLYTWTCTKGLPQNENILET